jgi:hypothetical protein
MHEGEYSLQTLQKTVIRMSMNTGLRESRWIDNVEGDVQCGDCSEAKFVKTADWVRKILAERYRSAKAALRKNGT